MKTAPFEPPTDRDETFARDLEELRRQARERRGRPSAPVLGLLPMTDRGGESSVCDAVFDGSDGTLLDGVPLPLRAAHERAQRDLVVLAAQCHREGGQAALRRHHHRRMDDLLLAWCDELATIGQPAPIREAMAILHERQRLAPALAHLERSLTPQVWQQLDRRRRRRGAAWNELARRWRIHHAFVTGAVGS